MSIIVVYGLHAGDGVVRYIGQTSDPIRRIRSHRTRSSKRGRELQQWLESINFDVQMVTLARVRSDDEANALEAAFIDNTPNLCNPKPRSSNRGAYQRWERNIVSESKDWVRVRDAAEAVERSVGTVYEWLNLPAERTGIRVMTIRQRKFVHLPSLLAFEATIKIGRPRKADGEETQHAPSRRSTP